MFCVTDYRSRPFESEKGENTSFSPKHSGKASWRRGHLTNGPGAGNQRSLEGAVSQASESGLSPVQELLYFFSFTFGLTMPHVGS